MLGIPQQIQKEEQNDLFLRVQKQKENPSIIINQVQQTPQNNLLNINENKINTLRIEDHFQQSSTITPMNNQSEKKQNPKSQLKLNAKHPQQQNVNNIQSDMSIYDQKINICQTDRVQTQNKVKLNLIKSCPSLLNSSSQIQNDKQRDKLEINDKFLLGVQLKDKQLIQQPFQYKPTKKMDTEQSNFLSIQVHKDNSENSNNFQSNQGLQINLLQNENINSDQKNVMLSSKQKKKSIHISQRPSAYLTVESAYSTIINKSQLFQENEDQFDQKGSFAFLNQSHYQDNNNLDQGQNSLKLKSGQISSSYNDTSMRSQKLNDISLTKSQAELSKQNLKQNEKIKAYNLQSKLDLKEDDISDIAISILQKNGKGAHEIKFLQKCIEGMPLFQKHQGLFEKSNTSQHLFQQIKHVRYSKNHVIFNFGEFGYHYYIVLKGSVFCLIPHNEFKEELIANQKRIDQMQQKLRRLQSKTKQSIQDEAKTFIDIVMLAIKQKNPEKNVEQQFSQKQQQQQQQVQLQSQNKQAQQVNSQSMSGSVSPLSKYSTDLLKQNNLFTSFLERKGVKIKQENSTEKQHQLDRRTNILDQQFNLGIRKANQQKIEHGNSNQLMVPPPEYLYEQKTQINQTSAKLIQLNIPQTQTYNQNNQQINAQAVNEQIQNQEEQQQESDHSIENEINDMLDNETSKEYLQRKFPQFFNVKVFKPGESFGEIALMTKERRQFIQII